MPSPEATRRLTSLGLLVLPLIAVKMASVIMGGSAPASTVAAPAAAVDSATPATPAPAKIEWTASQRAAGDHVRQLASEGFGPTPMLYATKPTQPVVHVNPEPPIVEPAEAEIPEFALHAVMATPSGDKALINGRLYEVGQKVADTAWIVKNINSNERSVTLTESGSSRSVTISVHRPSSGS